MQMERTFIFRGNASGVAAHIRRPDDEVVPVQAASSLPVIGGLSESTAEGKKFKYLSFESAQTSAHGDFDDPPAAIDITWQKRAPDSVPTTTTVISEVKGLTLLNSVRIDLIRAEMVAHSAKRGEQTSISPRGSAILGLMIEGAELLVTLNDEFFRKYDTKEKLDKAMDAGQPSAAHHCFQESEGIIYATLVEELHWADKQPPGVTFERNVVTIPDFGKLYLGEVFIMESSRRVTMVRADLGSPTGGKATGGSIETNGSSWPA
jgi:hypothetical protein